MFVSINMLESGNKIKRNIIFIYYVNVPQQYPSNTKSELDATDEASSRAGGHSKSWDSTADASSRAGGHSKSWDFVCLHFYKIWEGSPIPMIIPV